MKIYLILLKICQKYRRLFISGHGVVFICTFSVCLFVGFSVFSLYFVFGILYRVGQKMAQFFVYLITSPNINRFSKFVHYQNQETICNKTLTINATTP